MKRCKANLHRKSQRGSALISALLLMSIVTMLAVGMLSRQDIQIRRTESIFQQQRLLAQASWVELWAMGILRTVSNQITPETDYITLEQIWTLPLEKFEREGIAISGQIFDLQSLFNVNNVLVNSAAANQQETEEDAAENNQNNPASEQTPVVENPAAEVKEVTPADYLTDENLYTAAWAFTRLMQNQVGLGQVPARALTESLLYWLMPNPSEMDNYYLQLEPPYRPAHQSLWSVSELRLIQGMTNEIYNGIRLFLMALPVSESNTGITRISAEEQPASTTNTQNLGNNRLIPVNINTVRPEVLAAILNVGLPEAESILSIRPFYTKESMLEQINKRTQEEKGGANAGALLDITSNYFLLRTEVSDDKRKLIQYTIMYRNDKGEILILNRVQGEL